MMMMKVAVVLLKSSHGSRPMALATQFQHSRPIGIASI